jgi:hypothetical protein
MYRVRMREPTAVERKTREIARRVSGQVIRYRNSMNKSNEEYDFGASMALVIRKEQKFPNDCRWSVRGAEGFLTKRPAFGGCSLEAHTFPKRLTARPAELSLGALGIFRASTST